MVTKRKYNKMMLMFPPGKVYVYRDGSPAARKHCAPPIGIAYLAANLLKHGYDAACLDILSEGYEQEEYREPFIIYGLNTEQVIERIRQENPDVVGFSVIFSMVVSEVYHLCTAIKKVFPELPIVFGGQHATGAGKDVMSHDVVDYVLQGEADDTIIQFMDALNGLRTIESVRGLMYRDENGETKNTMDGVPIAIQGKDWNYYDRRNSSVPQDLDGLPFPAWHLFNLDAYWSSGVRTGGGDAIGERYAVMVSTRGCPHVCTYCTSPLQSGYRAFRRRSIESVFEEIRWLVDTYRVTEIQFVEDNFFVSKRRTKELLRRLAQEFPDLVFWNTGGVEVNALDKEMIDLMAEANFHRAILAIEAGDPGVQERSVDKRVQLDRLPKLVNYMYEKGIDLKALYMIGFPGETREEINRTVELAKTLGVLDFNLSIVQAFPGTPLYDECLEKGLLLEGTNVNNLQSGTADIKLPDVTPDELETIRRSVWKESFTTRMTSKTQDALRERTGFRNPVMHKISDIDEYQTLGFHTKPPTREPPKIAS